MKRELHPHSAENGVDVFGARSDQVGWMRDLMLEIDLAAPPTRVWEVLTDFSGYAAWNSQQTIAGKAAQFEKLKVTSRASQGRAPVDSTIFIWKLEPEKKLELVRGNLLLLGSKRVFYLSPSERGTLLRHGACMVGIWSRLRYADGAHLATYKHSLEVFQFDIKRAVEGSRTPAKTVNRHARRSAEHLKSVPGKTWRSRK